MDAIVAREVVKRYGSTVALDGVSLSVGAGEVFGLIGPNGAGKTTLVRALTGTTDPDEGEVALLEESPRSVGRDRIGLLPQAFLPADRLTARELVAYYAGLYDDARDPDAVLADVGLTDAADTRYEDLSGGQQRRACVGTALVNDPEVLFLDEPTTGIDPAGRRALWGLLEDLAACGTTILLTTHYMEEAERLADRVGLLAGGELLAVGTPAELIDEYGGESRVEIETAGQSTGADAADAPQLAADAAPLDEYTVEVRGQGLVVRGVGPREIGDVVDALATASVEYESLTWAEPDLEDVYLNLSGEGDATSDSRPREAIAGGDHQ
ncbi:ABC transporter ATP-binding protein [Halobacteriales archaeon QS_1_68_20]|nr:MAG: ABC transporter ATP-binding protein [Halobacteriales archaeon QS_1_68_20]